MSGLMFLGNTTFNNVWLIDRIQTYSMSDSVTDPDFGILLNLKYFVGFLTIGGDDYFEPEITKGKSVKFMNLVGHYNDYTVAAYPWWNVALLQNDTQNILRIKSGLGAVLFNTASETNAFTSISFNNVIFNRVYGRQEAPKGLNPLIMSTYVSGNTFMSSWEAKVTNVTFEDILFDQGSRLLDFATIKVFIANCTFKNIGLPFNYLTSYNTFDLKAPIGGFLSPIIRSYMAIGKVSNMGQTTYLNTFISLENSTFLTVKAA